MSLRTGTHVLQPAKQCTVNYMTVEITANSALVQGINFLGCNGLWLQSCLQHSTYHKLQICFLKQHVQRQICFLKPVNTQLACPKTDFPKFHLREERALIDLKNNFQISWLEVKKPIISPSTLLMPETKVTLSLALSVKFTRQCCNDHSQQQTRRCL